MPLKNFSKQQLNQNNRKGSASVNLFILVLLGFFVVVSSFLGLKFLDLNRNLTQAKTEIKIQEKGKEILNFTQLLVKEVLSSKTAVNFETRLQLENAVRELGDEEILEQWKKFTGSQEEEVAQEQVKILLELLIDKSYQNINS